MRKIICLSLFLFFTTAILNSSEESNELTPKKENSKWGYVDSNNKVVIPFKYDEASDFSYGLAAVKFYGKWGFIGKNGKVIIPFKYDEVKNFNDGFAYVKFKDEWFYIDENDRKATKDRYGNPEVNDSFVRFQKDKYSMGYGLKDKNGKIIFEPKYTRIGDFYNGFAMVERAYQIHNPFWGFINEKGVEVVATEYDSFEVKENRKYIVGNYNIYRDQKFVIDLSGVVINGVKYDAVYDYFDEAGFKKVTLNGKYGLIDKSGKQFIPPKYDYIYDFDDGFVKTKMYTGFILEFSIYGLIDKKGREIVKPKYTDIGPFKDGFAIVGAAIDNWYYYRYGLIDKNGKEIIAPNKYDHFYDFVDNYAMVSVGGYWDHPFDNAEHYIGEKYGLVSKDGKEIIIPKYDKLELPNGGIVAVEFNGVPLKIDITRRSINGNIYDNVYQYNSNGLAVVMKDNKYGLIDRGGKEIVKPKYNYIYPFGNSIARCELEIDTSIKYGFIDNRGKVVADPKYDELLIDDFGSGDLARVRVGENWGVIDINNNTIAKILYGEIFFKRASESNDENMIGSGSLNEKWGALYRDGKFRTFDYSKYGVKDPVFYDGLAFIKKDGKWGYINIEGDLVIPFIYEKSSDDPNYFGYLVVESDGHYGLINNKSGELIVPAIFKNMEFVWGERGYDPWIDGIVNVEMAPYGTGLIFPDGSFGFDSSYGRGSEYGVIDKERNVKKYSDNLIFSENLAPAEESGYWGFINKSGEVVIPFAYEYAYPFFDGYAPVKLDGRWGFIDSKNNFVYHK